MNEAVLKGVPGGAGDAHREPEHEKKWSAPRVRRSF